jgi:D-aspartate ligase
VKWACLSGTVQIAYCWLLLYEVTGDERDRGAAFAANRYVRRTVAVKGPGEVRGGVKGSVPVYGGCLPYKYPNWACKFMIDSNLLEMSVREKQVSVSLPAPIELQRQRGRVAVIVGLEANGLGMARSLARRGIRCLALAGPGWTPLARTNACDVVFAKAWTGDALVSDLKDIAAHLDQKSPLLLTKDQAVLWVSEAREELQELFEIALPSKETTRLLMSKQGFTALAKQENWPVPLTWDIANRDELVAHFPDFVYPCILKPRIKNDEFRRYSPRKAFRVNSADELLKTYDLVAQWETEVVVQEWIEGGDDRIAFCLSYCDRGSTPRALFAGRKLMQWPLGYGNTAICEPAPESWQESILSLTRKIWRTVGYQGLGSIEYKMRPGSDGPVIMEPTVGRTDFQSEVAVLNGENIPAIAYCDLAGLDYVPAAKPHKPVKLVDGPAHLRAGWVYCSHSRRLGLAKWLQARRGRKQFMIWRANDVGPFFASIYVAVRGMLGDFAELLLGQNMKKRVANSIRSLFSKARWGGVKEQPRRSK